MNHTSFSSLHRFEAYCVARDLVAALGPLVARVARADRDLARQLRRAATSVPLNLAEGRRRKGRDRAHHFAIASGSADEVLAGLEVAIAWGYLPAPDATEALGLLDRLGAMLWRLSR